MARRVCGVQRGQRSSGKDRLHAASEMNREFERRPLSGLLGSRQVSWNPLVGSQLQWGGLGSIGLRAVREKHIAAELADC